MNKFVVLGANGGTGLEIVNRLVEISAGEVVAVVRNPSKASSCLNTLAQSPNVTLVAGDVTDENSLKTLLPGAKAVFFAASGKGYQLAIDVDQNGPALCAKVLTEAKEQKNCRIVVVSSQLVHPTNRWSFIRGMLNTVVTGLFRKQGLMDFKYKGEQLLRNSGVGYVIVRPGRLVDGPAFQRVACVGQTNGSFMSGQESTRADTAAVCVAAAVSELTANTTFELATRVPTKEEKIFRQEEKKDVVDGKGASSMPSCVSSSAVSDPFSVAPPSDSLFSELKQKWGEDWE